MGNVATAGSPATTVGVDQAGQASIELVALLPCLAVVLALAWQAVLAGEALWGAAVAARAAARASALGTDAAAAARAHLPASLERGLRVAATAPGRVTVSIRVPAVVPGARLGRVRAHGSFEAGA